MFQQQPGVKPKNSWCLKGYLTFLSQNVYLASSEFTSSLAVKLAESNWCLQLVVGCLWDGSPRVCGGSPSSGGFWFHLLSALL